MPTNAPPFRSDVSALTYAGVDLSDFVRAVEFEVDVAENDTPTLSNPGQQDIGTIRHRCTIRAWQSFDVEAGGVGLYDTLEPLVDPTIYQELVYSPVAGGTVTFTAQAKLPVIPKGSFEPGENVEIELDLPLQAEPVYANTATPAA